MPYIMLLPFKYIIGSCGPVAWNITNLLKFRSIIMVSLEISRRGESVVGEEIMKREGENESENETLNL
jgi:hypothetical protein